MVSLVLIAIDTWGPHPTGQAERAALNLWRDRFAHAVLVAGMAGLAAGALLPLIGAGTGLLAAGGLLALDRPVALRGRLGARRAERAAELMATGLRRHPPAEQWDSWTEYDPAAWPRKVPREYMLVPTVCFNCEAACGLLAYVDKENLEIQKLEGNPHHPGSRGRNCAKGPATINQITDPERILYPHAPQRARAAAASGSA